MAPNGLHPALISRNQVQPTILTLGLILILVLPTLSKSQESTGFKPSTNTNVDKNGSGGPTSVGKVVDFITGNPNQRSLPNNSQSQSYADYNTRGLGNYIGGGLGGIGNGGGTSISAGQFGYYPPNFGPFGGGSGGLGIHPQGPQFGLGGGNKGLPYPGGPYQFPLGQYPVFNHPHQGSGIGKIPFQQIPQQQYPFNPNPPLGPPGAGGFFQQGFPGSQAQGYPYPGGVGGIGGGGGAGHLHLGIPKQVRVPGRIEISLSGNDAEIICEFPRFLILIQKVYWHHKYDDPYGTYYDTSNRFGPRVTVITPDKWRSVLQIRDYNEDDFGTYRCLSAAILPDEGNSSPYEDNRGQYLLRSPSTTTEISASPPPQQQDYLTRQKVTEQSKTRNSKDMKFHSSSTNRVTRKIRFSRSTIPKPLLDTSASKNHNFNYNQIDSSNNIDGSGKSALGGSNKDISTTPEFDLTKQGSEEVYDPYHYQGHQDQEGPTSRNYFLDHNNHHHPGSRGPFATSSLPPIGGHIQNPHQYQDPRYGGIGGGYGGGYPNPNYARPGPVSSNNYGPYAPYYKPSYGIFMIYQEIKFAHPQSRGGTRNTSIRSNSV